MRRWPDVRTDRTLVRYTMMPVRLGLGASLANAATNRCQQLREVWIQLQSGAYCNVLNSWKKCNVVRNAKWRAMAATGCNDMSLSRWKLEPN